MLMKGARVSLLEGEKHRKTLLDRGILDINYKIAYDGDFIIYCERRISGYKILL